MANRWASSRFATRRDLSGRCGGQHPDARRGSPKAGFHKLATPEARPRGAGDGGMSGARHSIIIGLAGEPKGKGRPRFVRRTGHAFTPQRTASYEACLRHEAALAMAGKPPLEGALCAQVNAYFGVPQSWSAKKRAAALAGAVRPTNRPDADNICKMLEGLNGIVFSDDGQIVSAIIEKYYSDRPRLRVEVAHYEVIEWENTK